MILDNIGIVIGVMGVVTLMGYAISRRRLGHGGAVAQYATNLVDLGGVLHLQYSLDFRN